MNSQDGSNQLVEEMLAHLKPPIPVLDQDDNSKVAAFYANRCVFITGATGFIGKALIEKLIRSCPRVKRIYILVREKRGKSIQERLTDLIKSQWFDKIRQTHEGSSRVLEEKLCAIRGDITESKFGISSEDMQMLSDECTIVINSAASVRFVEPIDIAVKNNIYSVGQLVEFCNELAHLEALIHLSTAYSNCHKRDTIHEIFYEPPMRGDHIQKAIENLHKIQLQSHAYPDLSSNNNENGTTDNMNNSHRDACKLQRFYEERSEYAPTSEANVAKNDAPAYDLLKAFTRIALRLTNRPNTYTFAKGISESYLLDKTRARTDRYLNDKIQVAIVRPSIVCAAWREPIVGFVDSFNGPTGGIIAVYTGALQAVPGVGTRVVDIVPVDMVTNMVLCTGWFLVEQSALQRHPATGGCDQKSASSKISQDQGMYLFNLVSGFRNPMRWHQMTDLIRELSYKYPSKYLIRLPWSFFIRPGRIYDCFDLICHKLPAYTMDLIMWLLCRRQEHRDTYMQGYKRIKQVTDTLRPFTSNQWKFSDVNTQKLYESLDPIDKQVFPFDVASIDWYEYLRAYIIGSRIYAMRDDPKNVTAAMKKLWRRRALNWIIQGSLIVLVLYVFTRSFL